MATEGVVHIVDDDPAVRNSLRFLLKASGYEAATYASGPELLSQAQELQPGCILTDVRMPEMNGLELLRRGLLQAHNVAVLRRNHVGAHLPPRVPSIACLRVFLQRHANVAAKNLVNRRRFLNRVRRSREHRR